MIPLPQSKVICTYGMEQLLMSLDQGSKLQHYCEYYAHKDRLCNKI